MVGASLEVMDRDSNKMRGERSFLNSNIKTVCLKSSPSPRSKD